MRAVVVAGRKPLYEMGAADLVVRGLDELSFINLKQLFSNEEGVEGNVSTLLYFLVLTEPYLQSGRECVGVKAAKYVMRLLCVQSEDGEPQPEPELEEDFSSDYWL